MHTHLEKPRAHAWILFTDFSFAFNRMQPYILAPKRIADFLLSDQLIAWIIDFLLSRPKGVSVNGHLSSVIVTNTGSP